MRRASAPVLAIAVAAGVLVPLWLLSSLGGGGGAPTHTDQRESTTFSDSDRGFSIAYPARWHRATESLTPILSDPKEMISVGTYVLRPGGMCAQYPSQAIEDLGPTDAMVTVQEDQALRPQQSEARSAVYLRFPPRPSHFGPDSGHGQDESPGCVHQPKEFFHRWIPFRDQGRTFYAYVAMGTDVDPAVAREAWGILDSLKLDPPPWFTAE